MDLSPGVVALCEFYFSDLAQSKRRPVLVYRDNLPFDDFVGIPLSSKTARLHEDESLIEASDFIWGQLPKTSKLMVRKTFVIATSSVVKAYGQLSPQRYERVQRDVCRYFGCQ